MNNPKNNSITYLPDCVIKCFSNPKHFQAELFAYQLTLPMLPKLLDYAEPNWIKIERIWGIPYLDNLMNFKPALLAETIAHFHLATYHNGNCLCHIDNAPKNILFCSGKYYFIDFAESNYACPEVDITHLLLFWAADFPYALLQSSVLSFIISYLSILKLDSARWHNSLLDNISLFDSRRYIFSKPPGKQPIDVQTANRNWLADLDAIIT
ncbi:MAG TPA: hypothetical protein PLJ85_00300 [Candidatus Cloacimonas sp.]|nr:hypothetical protein [Candidatus Cloacimonas sp.]